MAGTESNSNATVAQAVARLRAGELVAFPTETVYGLGADALNPAAVERVFALKGRPSHNPLIVHVTGIDMARSLAAEWPDWAQVLASRFWPGPLTIVVPSHARVSLNVRAGGPTVALRAPAHPIAQALLMLFGGPLVGPSANRSGFVSPTAARHVLLGFPEAVARGDLVVLDGGPCQTGIESTVVAMNDAPGVGGGGVGGVGGVLRVLRPGVIGPVALAEALNVPVDRIALGPAPNEVLSATNEPLASPGLLASHYAPRARAVLFRREQWGELVAWEQAQASPRSGGPIAVLSRGPWPSAMPNLGGAGRVIALPMDAEGYARGLYAALRELDETNPTLIAIEAPPMPGEGADELWAAIADRLARASKPWVA